MVFHDKGSSESLVDRLPLANAIGSSALRWAVPITRLDGVEARRYQSTHPIPLPLRNRQQVTTLKP